MTSLYMVSKTAVKFVIMNIRFVCTCYKSFSLIGIDIQIVIGKR